jgi:hypothetical protein
MIEHLPGLSTSLTKAQFGPADQEHPALLTPRRPRAGSIPLLFRCCHNRQNVPSGSTPDELQLT